MRSKLKYFAWIFARTNFILNLPSRKGDDIASFIEKRIPDVSFERSEKSKTVDVAQLVRASVCGAEGRGFESHLLPRI